MISTFRKTCNTQSYEPQFEFLCGSGSLRVTVSWSSSGYGLSNPVYGTSAIDEQINTSNCVCVTQPLAIQNGAMLQNGAMFPHFANQNVSAHELCAINIFHGTSLLGMGQILTVTNKNIFSTGGLCLKCFFSG